MYRGNIVLHVTYSVVYVIQRLYCVARDPLTLELYPVWYAYICVNMTNTKMVSINYVHILYLNTNIYAIILKLKLLNIRLNGMFIGGFFNFESLLHVLKYREKYFFRYVFFISSQVCDYFSFKSTRIS